ncbi:MAG: hypothetical protein KIT16_23430, partial [Rhodospirillaceae bacterium]|nr:hypothetical protein [Rhodospirillaceae bacterium]
MTLPQTLARRLLLPALIAIPVAVQAQEAPQSRLGAYLAGRIAEAEHDMAEASRFYGHALADDAF